MQRRLPFVAAIRGFRDLTGAEKAPLRPIPSLLEPARNRVKVRSLRLDSVRCHLIVLICKVTLGMYVFLSAAVPGLHPGGGNLSVTAALCRCLCY